MYRWMLCLVIVGSLLVSDNLAGPPRGRGGGGGGGGGWGGGGGGDHGPSGGFGYSIGIGSPGSGFQIGVGNVSPMRGYHGGGYGGGGYQGGGYGNWYGGSGVYFGGGSRDFHWGIGVPFGYGDYGWYAPYYNYYHRHYYTYEPETYTEYYTPANITTPSETQTSMDNPPVPTAAQVARLTDEQLRMMIAVALDHYNQYLDTLTTGAGWKKHFKLADLKEHVISSAVGALDAAERELFVDISQKFEIAAKESTYDVITQPWSFKTLQVALKEYSLPTFQRQAHMLSAKALTLKHSLDKTSTGAGWKTYLKLEELENLLTQSSADNTELNTQLEKILQRFDDVKQNEEYKSIAELPGFAVTRVGLKQYIKTLNAEMPK